MALPEFPTFIEGRHRGGFIVRESAGSFRSRDLATLTNSSAAAITYPAGLVLEIATAQSGTTPAVVLPYSSTVTAGTPGALLFEPVTVLAGATMKVTIVSRDAEVNAAELAYDASITTAAAQATLLAVLATKGIIAR
ncbi:MAG: head decoration protein [Janthinobacterium lividum]